MHMCKMESYCLKCKKHTGNTNPRVSSTSNGKVMYYRNAQYVIVKNLNLLINKKQVDY